MLAAETPAGQVYAAVEPSMKGDITVYTTIADNKIVGLDVIDDVDSTVIRDAAIDGITTTVVKHQSVAVDAVAGATVTSAAILSGVRDAIEAAGLDTSSFEKAPTVERKKEKPREEFDLVVVGSGMAGLSAAIEAAHNGASVLVLEKLAYTGGSTRACGGGIWAMGSRANEIGGQDCSLEDYASFMTDWSAPTELNQDLLAAIHDASGPTFDYLIEWGLPVAQAKWSLGNKASQIPCFSATAGIGSEWETGESGIADYMEARAKLEGAEIRLNSKVAGLVAEDGAVKGVQVEDLDSTYEVFAGSVILASGGFTRSAELIERYAPDYSDAFAFTGAGSTGDGIMMAEPLGAQIVGIGMMGLSGINPNLGYYYRFGSLVNACQMTVNAEGVTFMDGAFYGNTLKLLLDQTNSCGYGICDGANDSFDRLEDATAAGLVRKYDTLEELASGEGINAEALSATAKEKGVSQPPFYCVVRKPLFIGSIPGLKVGASCEVLDESDKPVAGLYAAGEIMFGNVFSNSYPCSGTGVGTSCYTGAIAAKAALGL